MSELHMHKATGQFLFAERKTMRMEQIAGSFDERGWVTPVRGSETFPDILSRILS